MIVPLYRLRNNVDHFYTTSEVERDNAISQFGYISEGIACYVLDSNQDVPLRDQFAIAAMGSMGIRYPFTAAQFRELPKLVTLCYTIADAMIAYR